MKWLLNHRLLLINFLIVVFCAAFGWGYLSRQEEKPSKPQMDGILQRIFEENQQLKTKVSEAEDNVKKLDSLLKEKEQELLTLSNAQALKQALVNAQTTISQLTSQIEQLISEKTALEGNNIQLNNRLQNVSSELIRTLEELKTARQNLTDLKASPKDTGAIQTLQADLDRLRAAKTSLEEQLIKKETIIKDIETLNRNLKTQIEQIDKASFGGSAQKKELQSAKQELERLKGEIAQYRSKVFALQDQLTLREQELLKVKDELKKQVSSNQGDFKGLYENAKTQIAQLYEILASKEIEMNNQRREAQDLRKQVSELQARLASIDTELESARADSKRANSLQADKIAIESKYLQAQSELQKQSELVAILGSNIDQLNKKILQQENERDELDKSVIKLSSEKASLEEELARQKKQLGDMDGLCAGLRTQIVQFSNLLNDKDSELKQREKQLQTLQDETSYQQMRVSVLEKELQEAKERQKKVFENLAQAASLNTEIQERLIGVSQSLGGYGETGSIEKKEAEELRRKVEVILTPENMP